MTAVRIASTRGAEFNKASAFTIGTDAPTSTFDFELRYNLLDQQSAALLVRDLILFLEGLEDGLESGGKSFFGTSVTGTNFTGPQI
jgi:hypothetical protein